MDFIVLIVDDEQEMCLALSELLAAYGIYALYTTRPQEVQELIGKKRIDLVIMDVKMPRLGGLDLLRMVKEQNRSLPIIMITGYPSVDNAVLAMKYGAADFLTKPLDNMKLIDGIKHFASAKERRQQESLPVEIVYTSSAMEKVVAQAKKVASTDAPVLITGESGTGKELIAELIHSLSPRKEETLIKVNCASIPEGLLESELFGHEAGAFTDAKKPLTGKFELAQKGTLFLDEIGDMSLATQPKILRVLQDGHIQRLGSEKTIQVNPRIITASNRDIDGMMEDGSFREDLYFRLSVVSIKTPPLRQRQDDISGLTERFITLFNQRYNKDVSGISEEVKNIFLRHAWPGNVRELKNCIERAVIFTESEIIREEDLPSQYQDLDDGVSNTGLDELVEVLTREQIAEALEKAGGVKYKAAEILNIHRKTLYNRMKSLGME